MKFSIITASLNQAQFIEDTLKSVLSQKGNFGIEYLVFDACSSDGTVDILKRYERMLNEHKYPIQCGNVSFHWVSEPDRGQSHAFNKGLSQASGDIVAFISSDDIYEPDAFRVVAEAFIADSSLDAIHGDGYFLNQNTGVKTLQVSKNISLKEMTTTLARIIDPSVFYRRDFINQIGFLDEKFHFVMVYEFLIRVLKHGRLQYIPRPLITFRLWDQSKTVTQKEKFINEIDWAHKKHGLSVLNPKRIQSFTSNQPFQFLRNNFPTIYTLLKRLFYAAARSIQYPLEK